MYNTASTLQYVDTASQCVHQRSSVEQMGNVSKSSLRASMPRGVLGRSRDRQESTARKLEEVPAAGSPDDRPPGWECPKCGAWELQSSCFKCAFAYAFREGGPSDLLRLG